jgi:hypothetical protein
MVINMKDSFQTIKRMVMAISFGQVGMNIKESSSKTSCMEKAR